MFAPLSGGQPTELRAARIRAHNTPQGLLLARLDGPEGLGRASLAVHQFDPAGPTIEDPGVELAADASLNFGASDTGVIVYRPARTDTSFRFEWVDTNGRPVGDGFDTIGPNPFNLSRDGTLLAFVESGDVMLRDLPRGVTTRLVPGPGVLEPVLSPDGRRLAYSVIDAKRLGIAVQSTAGGTPQIVYEAKQVVLVEDWSADGRFLAANAGNRGLIIPLESKQPPMVYAELPPGVNPDESRFSPDGGWLVFNAAESGRQEVYLVPVPPTGERWQLSVAGGTQGRFRVLPGGLWRSDGRRHRNRTRPEPSHRPAPAAVPDRIGRRAEHRPVRGEHGRNAVPAETPRRRRRHLPAQRDCQLAEPGQAAIDSHQLGATEWQHMPRLAWPLSSFLVLFAIGPWGQSPSPFVSVSAQGPSLAQFVASLQQAVARNDRNTVAGMVRYPIEVQAGGLQIPVSDASSFVKIYDSVMSQAVRQAVTGARVGPDATAPVTLGGAVTIGAAQGGYRITGIKVPAGATSKPPGEMIERQLSFRVGQPTQVSGTLEAGGTDRFILYAARGAYLDIRLSGVPGRSVLVRLLDAGSGKPVDARADTGTRVWTGRVGAEGNYRIEVVRQADSGKEPLIYTMAVTMK
jgi:hypothetical protein